MLGDAFVFGVNIPWFEEAYGHDLGPDPQHPQWGVWHTPSRVSEYYQGIYQMGFRVVRLFLCEGAEGIIFDSDECITGLHETFLQNLDDVVNRSTQEHLTLYLTLTSKWSDLRYPSPIKNESQQQAYLENVVRPVTRRLKNNSAIFAFDIFNEIESELRDEAGPQKVSVEQAQSFIRNNVLAIKEEDPLRLVSSGSGYHSWEPVQKGYYRNLGLDFYDFHTYRDDGFLPDVNDLDLDKPVIVGECGQKSEVEDDDLQQRCVPAFLQNAISNGYAGCFIWAYSPKEKYWSLLRRDTDEPRPVVANLKQIIER